jgi:CRISPR-associated endoribonuclease Cas2 subtype I-E
MAFVTILLNQPQTIVRGVLRNALLEAQTNVFVGQLDAKRIEAVIALLERHQADALLCAYTRKSLTGVKLRTFGSMPNRSLVEIDGIQLISKAKSLR